MLYNQKVFKRFGHSRHLVEIVELKSLGTTTIHAFNHIFL
uniref:Uncharacterized protein n=1 Tax=Rhizophora mucronata TaxID=61149 RepID=A0A2P2P2D4_RHIMU